MSKDDGSATQPPARRRPPARARPDDRQRSRSTPPRATAAPRCAFRRTAAGQRTSYRELGADVRALAKGLIALGVAARRPRRDPLEHPRGVDAGRLRRDVRGRHRSSRSTRPTRPRSASTCSITASAIALFCEDAGQLEKLAEIRDALPELEHVFRFDGEGDGAMTLDDLRAAGADVSDADLDARVAAIAHDDVATIVYTSGTTGPPKGCMLTHGNLRSDIDGVHGSSRSQPGEDVALRLPAARPRAHADRAAVRDRRGRRDGLLAPRPEEDRRGRPAHQADAPALGAAHLREDPHRRDREGRGGRRREGQALSLGRRRRARGQRGARTAAGTRGSSSRRSTRSPTSSSCTRSATCSAAA